MCQAVPGHENRWRSVRSASNYGPVIYWMSRDQRLKDNWALYHAWKRAHQADRAFAVVFCLSPRFSLAGPRHYHFMMQGLQEISNKAREVDVPFFLLQGEPAATLPRFIEEWNVSLTVTDFDPLKVKRIWRAAVMENSECGFEEVDAHNIVPCWAVSPKQDYSAATFRPKLRSHMPDYFDHLPPFPSVTIPWPGDVPEVELEEALRQTGSYPHAQWLGGEAQANKVLHDFIRSRLEGYEQKRNDPNQDGQSGLSPYLHFGMISAQTVALAVRSSTAPQVDKDAFLEELIVRRELSDNFCHYNQRYDEVEGFPAWAKATIRQHLGDRREYIYREEELESARTHDPLWNAAQRQMVVTGKMHGWLRMYWAKKLLEWTETPEEALRLAITLNDRYEMDGRDPNGHVGAAWSIGGVHDRAWGERSIFGKVRYMNLSGARRKFDVDLFASKFSSFPDR
ncbi:MAG: deoxyribodipyrimidine photo-lyase [Methanomassiliicoccales archaeon]|nr:deoxyribodipyrimidine photo-lyase [Methanomassiliicoccales archaeon]